MAERYLGATFDIHGGGVDLDLPAPRERARAVARRARRGHVRALLDAQRLPQLRRRQDLEVRRVDASVLFKRAFKLRARHRAPRRRGAALLPAHHAVPQPARLRGHRRRRRRARPRRCASPASRRPSAAASTRYLTLRAAARRARRRQAGRRRRRRARGRALARALQSALDDDFNTAEALAAWNEALALANRILDGKLDAPKDVKRRTLERLARDLRSRRRSSASATPSRARGSPRIARAAVALLAIDAAAVEALHRRAHRRAQAQRLRRPPTRSATSWRS